MYEEPSVDAKLWVLHKLVLFIHETGGKGDFKTMVKHLNLDYIPTYETGAMTISNSISSVKYEKWLDYID